MSAEFLRAAGVAVRHGFFTRRGGVSAPPYDSLNCSLSSADLRENVARNRGLVAAAMSISPENLLGLTQVHGTRVVTVEKIWPAGAGPDADGMVTRVHGIALGIVTADCAPVLFADAQMGVVGAAHAGWRGACAGILENMVDALIALGARRTGLRAAVGPCIAQASYEVGADLRDSVLAEMPGASKFFADGVRPGHWQFDLSGYCLHRLQVCGIAAESLATDTCDDEARFFSHRRRSLRQSGPIGHQISVIVA